MTSRRVGLIVIWCLAGLLTLFVPQMPGCVLANLPKVGSVVDATTGRGVPDVNVVASAIFNADAPLHGSTHDFPYRVLARTDAEGRYRIRSTWRDMRITLPGLDAREVWFITGFKPGYVVSQDRENLSKFDEGGRTIFRPPSTTQSPPSTWRGSYVEVAPLSIVHADLTLPEAATYYRDIVGAGLYVTESRDTSEIALRAEAYADMFPKVCSEGAEQTLSADVGISFASFVLDSTKFVRILQEMEPAGFGDASTNPRFHAQNICSAMKASNQ